MKTYDDLARLVMYAESAFAKLQIESAKKSPIFLKFVEEFGSMEKVYCNMDKISDDAYNVWRNAYEKQYSMIQRIII